VFAINGYSQTEFSSNAMDGWIQVLKLKSNSATVAPPDIVAPNILKKVRSQISEY
jgi:hypothetical protein